MIAKKLLKFLVLVFVICVASRSLSALPEYLKLYAADPFSRPELRTQCSLCHVRPEGGGARNAFGIAFAAEGHKITPELRSKFPDRFVADDGTQRAQPEVTFPKNTEYEAIVEISGQKYLINTHRKTITLLDDSVAQKVKAAPPKTRPNPTKPASEGDILEPIDVRNINLPTAISIPKNSLWVDFTHRFPFNEVTDPELLFGLDGFAVPSFGFTYGITNHVHAGAFRSSSLVGRPIGLFAGVTLLEESKDKPMNLEARVTLEGRDNFKRNFSTTLELAFAKSITRYAQLYVVPAVTLGDRPLGVGPARNYPGRTAWALGVGGAFSIRPTVLVMAEANMRLSESARYEGNQPEYGFGIHRPVVGFGIEKMSKSRRHSFTLTFSNGPGTTPAQRSMTRGLLFSDDSFGGMTIGFNLTRRLF
jgi:hypothetical protein